MSLPREGSRDTGEGIVISKYPDVCKSPVVPVPYTIVAVQKDDANTATSVRMTKQRAHKQSSIITCCTGDEPGTGLGVKSGTVKSVCHRKEHSSNVRIEGEWATRHNDEWWMNNKNTIGKLVYVKNTESFEPTPPFVEYQLAQAAAGTATDAATQPRPSTPTPRPSGQVIQGPAQWFNRPPPAPEPPPMWVRFLRRSPLGLLLSMEGSTPRHQRYLGAYPSDPELRRVYDHANELLSDSHEHNQAVAEWYRAETAAIRAQQEQDDDDLPEQGRTPGVVTVTRTEEEDDEECHEVVTISRSAHPESAQHILDAQAAGHPRTLTIDRPGAPARRRASTGGFPREPGKQPDEYPPAMFLEGGAGASVRNISASDNMGAGASMGNQLRSAPEGCKATIVVGP